MKRVLYVPAKRDPGDNVASIVGAHRVIAGSVEFGATFMEPGVSSLTTAYAQFKQYAFQIGELNGETTERIQRVKKYWIWLAARISRITSSEPNGPNC